MNIWKNLQRKTQPITWWYFTKAFIMLLGTHLLSIGSYLKFDIDTD